jgi:general secretion pathway protein D
MRKSLMIVLLGVVTHWSQQPAAQQPPPTAPAAQDRAAEAAREEIIRRQEAQLTARQLIEQGQKLIGEARYEEAVTRLEQALKMLPRAKATEADYTRGSRALGDAYARWADEAYRAADMAVARQRAQKALEYEPRHRGAESLIVKIRQAEGRGPEAARPPAPVRELRPDRTPEFTAKRDQLKKLFREGKILLNSGQYDEAERRFKQILLIDPYNEDAHVFLGELNSQRLGIAQTGADVTRARRLWEVTDAWIPPIGREVQVPTTPETPGVIGAAAARQAEVQRKLNEIIIPEISLREAVITDVIKFLSDESRRRDPKGVGVNIVLQIGEVGAPPPGPEVLPGEAPGPPPEAIGVGAVRRVTLSLREIPLIEALKYVTQVAGLKFRVEPSAVLVLPKDAPEGELVTRSYPVESGAIKAVLTLPTPEARGEAIAEYRAVGEAAVTVQPLDVKQFFTDAGVPFPPGSSLAYNERTSTIIVRNTPENLEIFERILATLNVIPKQVEIEAKFVEISQSDLDELGFRWLVGQYQSGDFLSEGGTPNAGAILPGGPATDADEISQGLRDSTIITANAIDALLGVAGGASPNQIATFRGILTNPQFTLVIKALSQKKSVDVLSAPKVTTIGGSPAQIKVVQEFIYPTEFTQPQVTAAGGGSTGGGAVGVTPSIPSTFKTREIGVLLNVTPQVGADGYTISLTLIPEVSEFLGFINYGGPFSIATAGETVTATNVVNQPLFSSRNLTTQVVVWDGQTVVLGGLIREDMQKLDDKIPFLGDIPMFGRLFRTKTTVRIKRNLLIFVTARLVDPSGNPIHRQETAALR